MVKVKNCEHCGLCCQCNPSLSDEEVKRIAEYLKLSKEKFINTFLNLNPRRTDTNQLLYGNDGYCVMVEHKKNGVYCLLPYAVKPQVCKDFGEDDCKKLKTEIGGF